MVFKVDLWTFAISSQHSNDGWRFKPCVSLPFIHWSLENPNFSTVSSSFCSAGSLKKVRFGGKGASKHEAQTFRMSGPEIGASHQVKIFVIVWLNEEEATVSGEQVFEELLSIKSDADCYWREQLVLWPARGHRVECAASPEDYWLLFCFLHGQLNNCFWLLWQEFWKIFWGLASGNRKDSSGVKIDPLSTFDSREAELLCAIPRFFWHGWEQQDVLVTGHIPTSVHFSVEHKISFVNDQAFCDFLAWIFYEPLLKCGHRLPFEVDLWISKRLLLCEEILIIADQISVRHNKLHVYGLLGSVGRHQFMGKHIPKL